jgi:hypothetical protein
MSIDDLPTGAAKPLQPVSLPAVTCCERHQFAAVASVPRAGPLPALRTFRCRICGHVETVESD